MFAAPVEAVWPGANGKIVFVKVDFSNPGVPAAQIYSMNRNGGNQRNLSAAGGGGDQVDIQPSVSPDGKRIAFARLDQATFSAQLWTMRIDGSQQTDISNDAALASESGPAWTEDGSKVLFVKQPPGSFPGEGGSIWIRRANGEGTPRQVTTGARDANPARWRSHCLQPAPGSRRTQTFVCDAGRRGRYTARPRPGREARLVPGQQTDRIRAGRDRADHGR